MVKVSIIVTAYNVEKYIGECIESILNQTFKDYELIIVNDCSTDSTLDIIKGYMEKDERIVLIDNEKNMGPGYSRHIGIVSSKGEYIQLIDGDDRITEKFISNLYNLGVKYDADIINGDLDMTNNYFVHPTEKVYVTEREKISFFYEFEKILFLNNKMVRRTLYDKVPYCQRIYVEDTPVYYKLLYYANKIVTDGDNETRYLYRVREDSLTHLASEYKNNLFKSLAMIEIFIFFNFEVEENEFKNIFTIFQLRNIVNRILKMKNLDEYKDEFPTYLEELYEYVDKVKEYDSTIRI